MASKVSTESNALIQSHLVGVEQPQPGTNRSAQSKRQAEIMQTSGKAKQLMQSPQFFPQKQYKFQQRNPLALPIHQMRDSFGLQS